MATGDRKDPYRNFRFRVEAGSIKAGFSEVIFGNATIDVIEYREGNELPVMRKLSGLIRFSTIQLKWGITDSMDLYKWYKQVADTGAEGARQNILITLIDEAGRDKSQWMVRDAWPIRYDPPDFSAKDSQVAIEVLEIAHEGFERTK